MYYVMVYPKWNMGNYIKSDKHFIRAKITFCVIIYGNEMYKSGFDQYILEHWKERIQDWRKRIKGRWTSYRRGTAVFYG